VRHFSIEWIVHSAISLVGKRYRGSGGGGRGGGGYGSYGGSGGGRSNRFDEKPRSAYGGQADGINAMFAQAYHQVAASVTGGAPGSNSYGGSSY